MTTSSADDIERVRITGPAAVVAAVPHLLGFHPRDSLVVIALTGPRSRIRLTMRFDLASCPPPDALAAEVAGRLVQADADGVILVAYPEGDVDVEASTEELPLYDLVMAVHGAAAVDGVDVWDALLAAGGRWRSYLCHNPRCCAGSAEVPEPSSHLAAVNAALGRVVLPDREALAASIRPVEGPGRVSMEQAFERQAGEIATRLGDDGPWAVCSESLEMYDAAIAAFREPRARLTDDVAARLLLALDDVLVRDTIPPRAATDGDAVVGLLTYLARRAVPPYDAPVCSVLGWVVYSLGNGALARIAVERALATDPTYSLALLVDELIHQQVPPDEVRRVGAAADRETQRQLRRRKRRQR